MAASSCSENILFQKIKSKNWDEAEAILLTEDGQEMAKEYDTYENLPLHAAIGYKASDRFILALLKVYPEATRAHGTDYWLPLHVAAMWGASSAVIEALIREYPQALDDTGEPGIKGRTPRYFSGRFQGDSKEMLEKPSEEWIKIIHAENSSTN